MKDLWLVEVDSCVLKLVPTRISLRCRVCSVDEKAASEFPNSLAELSKEGGYC